MAGKRERGHQDKSGHCCLIRIVSCPGARVSSSRRARSSAIWLRPFANARPALLKIRHPNGFPIHHSDMRRRSLRNVYRPIGIANLNGLNPKAYLRHVLEHIADRPITRIQELLPWKHRPKRANRKRTRSLAKLD